MLIIHNSVNYHITGGRGTSNVHINKSQHTFDVVCIHLRIVAVTFYINIISSIMIIVLSPFRVHYHYRVVAVIVVILMAPPTPTSPSDQQI